jgi:preprotein translocase subunit SecD
LVFAFMSFSLVLSACAAEDISETLAKTGGLRLVVQVQRNESAPGGPAGSEVVERTRQVLDRRLSKQNVKARVMRKEGASDAIVIDLVPVDDMQAVKALIRARGSFEIAEVKGRGFDRAEAERLLASTVPGSDVRILPEVHEGNTEATWYTVSKTALATNDDVRNSSVVESGPGWGVRVDFSKEAGERLGRFTEAHIGGLIAIVLDDRVVSAPVIQGRVAESVSVEVKNKAEATDLQFVTTLERLPAPLVFLEESVLPRQTSER